MRIPCNKPRGRRPCADESAPAQVSARLFLCALCRALMLVGSCCDRGQVYCTGDCAEKTRRHSMREAGKRYQASRKGRQAHAARQDRYRERKRLIALQGTTAPTQNAAPAAAPARENGQANWRARRVHTERSGIWLQKKKVTHHGSPRRPAHDVVPANAAATGFSHCHWCGCPCSPLVRSAFLRR
jgi:hypothetical protein